MRTFGRVFKTSTASSFKFGATLLFTKYILSDSIACVSIHFGALSQFALVAIYCVLNNGRGKLATVMITNLKQKNIIALH